MPRITLFGFYNYDPALFDGIQLPAGCDPQILKDTIIMECGDLYTYYQHPGYLKLNINSWFRRMLPQFERAYNAITVQYAPNENYDRYEEWEDTGKDSRKAKNENETKTHSEASGTREDKVSPFDATTYTPKAKTESSNEDDSTTGGTASTEESGENSGKHVGHLHGNIGVTTNAALIKEELDLRRYDFYLDIARQFQDRFIVKVY